MSISNIKTGYFDKYNNEIKINDHLLFKNGSKYIVLNDNNNIILKSLSNNNMPFLLLSKITYGHILSSALIIKKLN